MKEIYTAYAVLNPQNQHFKKPAEKQMLNHLASALEKVQRYPLIIGSSIRTIQAFGNIGSHDKGLESNQLTKENIQVCMKALKNLVEWYWQDLQLDIQLLGSEFIESSNEDLTDGNLDITTIPLSTQSMWSPLKPFVMVPFYWWLMGALFLSIITFLSVGLVVIVFIPYLGFVCFSTALKRHFINLEHSKK